MSIWKLKVLIYSLYYVTILFLQMNRKKSKLMGIVPLYTFRTTCFLTIEIPFGRSVDEPCSIRVQCQIHVCVRHRNDTNTCDIFNHLHFLKLLLMFMCQYYEARIRIRTRDTTRTLTHRHN